MSLSCLCCRMPSSPAFPYMKEALIPLSSSWVIFKSNYFTKAVRLHSEPKTKRKNGQKKSLYAWGKPDISSHFGCLSLVSSLGHWCRTLCHEFLSRLWLRIVLFACRGTYNWMRPSPFNTLAHRVVGDSRSYWSANEGLLLFPRLRRSFGETWTCWS